MAFECKLSTVIDSTKNSEDNTKATSNHILSSEKILLETLITDSTKPTYSRSTTIPTPKLPVNKTITDLPPALISEIFNCLDPKELGLVSCVNPSLYQIASDHHVWKQFYCERWGLPAASGRPSGDFSGEKSWKELFVEREYHSKTFMGRFNVETLYGHTETVRTVFLLPSRKLVFTSGYDSIVRMWDMEEGISISASRPLGCTIRALSADSKLLIAGGSDGFIHGWFAEEGKSRLFDMNGCHGRNQEDRNRNRNRNHEFRLWEHQGPITCLALDHTKIYSGSWDMTVRVYDRVSLKCTTILMHNDWVWSLVPHDNTVVSTAGSDLYIWETNSESNSNSNSASGSLIDIYKDAHVGNAYSLARSHTGSFVFTGGEDGTIHMFEIVKNHNNSFRTVATWNPHSGPVHSLSFEFPWLVSGSGDGKLSLIDIRKLLKGIRAMRSRTRKSLTMEPPQRMLSGAGGSVFSVSIGADRILCGGEEGLVRVWDFTRALEREKRAAVLKGLRAENRMRRQKHQKEIIESKSGRGDQCLIAVKNQMNGERSGVWYNKRGLKVKG